METILDAVAQQEIIGHLVEKLRANYIFPDVAEQICRCLQQHLADGDYAGLTEGDLFALALTLHLQEINHDEHLWVRWHAERLPDEAGQLRLNPEWQEQRRLEAGLDNYGIHRAERLPGNIGYLDIRYFHRPAWGGDTAAAAMTFVANTQALIIDLRNCTGGYPGMVALMLSYLFGEEPLLLDSIYWRDDDRIQQYWTVPYLPGKRFGDKPVYVLTSRTTFSAGEEFANILKTRQRATLVGDRTDGGAHPGVSYRLHPHVEAFIPIGRPVNPLTGADWEGSGVTPDIAIVQERALTAAYALALHSLQAARGEAAFGAQGALAKEIHTALKDLSIDRSGESG
jgi:hypothetical protein